MAIYSYDELKKVAKKVRAGLARKGFFIEKGPRLKERDREKLKLLFPMAINRIKRYPPVKTEKGIILPYYSHYH
ncbi:MAG: hypothetical protein OHK0032_18740 [Thermodesulfovibrionales bacterium]